MRLWDTARHDQLLKLVRTPCDIEVFETVRYGQKQERVGKSIPLSLSGGAGEERRFPTSESLPFPMNAGESLLPWGGVIGKRRIGCGGARGVLQAAKRPPAKGFASATRADQYFQPGGVAWRMGGAALCEDSVGFAMPGVGLCAPSFCCC